MEPCSSLVADFAVYLRTRILTGRVLALLVLVCVAGLLSIADVSMTGLPANLAFTALVVAQLRLWDDLADRTRDGARFPGRLLVRTSHARSFVWFLFASVILAVLILVQRVQERQLMVYLALLSLLALIYHTERGARLPQALRVSLVLVKYPLLVLITWDGELAARAWYVALALYAVLVAFEWYDDGELRSGTTLSSTAAAWSCGTVVVLVAFLLR